MSIDTVTPIGRLVQGGVMLQNQTNDDGTPKLDKDGSGKQVQQCFLAVAFAKTDPAFPAFYAQMVAVARAEFPHLFDAAGNCTHPHFAWKIQDGDGVDNNGKSVADKPGFAGHYIVKMATQYLPNCFHEGKFDATQQMQNPADLIKRGYFVRCGVRISGNGVKPQDTKLKPGLFLSPTLVSLVAFGPEITSGPDAAKMFGEAPIGALPAGASAIPVGAASAGLPGAGLTPPPLPVVAPVAAALPVVAPLPQMAVAVPALPAAGGLGPPPGVIAPAAIAQPAFQMTASAMGGTREGLHAKGWTDEQLIAAGHMIQIPY